MTPTQQLKRLFEVKVANYRAFGDNNPEEAAKFAVEGIMVMYRMYHSQPKYLEQLLDEEIEDAIKAGEIRKNAYQ